MACRDSKEIAVVYSGLSNSGFIALILGVSNTPDEVEVFLIGNPNDAYSS
jgi:hypothetical protein